MPPQASPPRSESANASPFRKLRAVVVEDEVLFQQLFRVALEAGGMVAVVGVATTVKEGVRACREHRPDLLMLDLALPDGDGLKVARALAKAHAGSHTIIVSAHADAFRCPPALRRHIAAVVEKTQTMEWVMAEVAALRSRLGLAAEPPGVPLSRREQEILKWIGDGLTNKEIGARACISGQTVATHRKSIAAKLGVRGAELVRFAALRSHSGRLGGLAGANAR